MKLTVTELTVARSGRPIFSQLDFTLVAGEALALTGPNGSGKSTLLRCLAGLLPVSSGYLALDIDDPDMTVSDISHYLGHRDAVKPTLTPLEHLDFWQSLFGPSELAPRDALDHVGLHHAADLPSAYLSAGQRRRLSLARLLVAERPLWLLDEPTAALDQQSEEMFARIVAAHLAKGGAAIIATHMPLPFPTRSLSLGERR